MRNFRVRHWWALSAIVMSLIFAFAAFAGGKELDAATRRELFKIYSKYTSEHFPDFVVNDQVMTPEVEDHESTWLVTYDLKRGYMGGTPIVFIDKKSLKVIRGYMEQ